MAVKPFVTWPAVWENRISFNDASILVEYEVKTNNHHVFSFIVWGFVGLVGFGKPNPSNWTSEAKLDYIDNM